MIKKILFTTLFALLLIPASQVSALYEDYSLADGVITDTKPWSSHSGSKSPCYIAYDVTLDGHDYSEQDALSYDFCHLEVGDTVKIKYLTSDSRKHFLATEIEIKQMATEREIDEVKQRIEENSGDKTNIIKPNTGPNQLLFAIPFGVVFFAVFFLIIISVLRTMRAAKGRLSDIDGDGLTNDNKPATTEQKKLIQEGFRQLGVYHEVKRNLTQAQARETLHEIDRKLKRK
jgi:hypothetical protein